MNTNQSFHEEYHYKSGYADHENLGTLAHAAIILARVSFFQHFSPGKMQTALIHRKLVRRLAASNAPFEAYLSCCKDLLALSHDPGRGNENPVTPAIIEQLLTGDPGAFPQPVICSTETLLPACAVAWTGLAEALLDILEDSRPDFFEYWIPWFRKRQANAELALFMRAMEFQTFTNQDDENE